MKASTEKKKTDLTSVSSSNQDVLLLADIAINSFLPMIAVHIRVHMFQNQIHLSKQTSFILNSTNVCSKKTWTNHNDVYCGLSKFF